MPSANGVYSLPPGYLAVTGTVIQASQHNPPLEDIAAALTGRLSRDGSAPMTGALQLIAGAVGLPGAAFSTDPTSGFYKTTAGIGVAIGGSKVAEFVAGGVIGSRVVGELVPFTGTAAPGLFVLPYGQTLSRTTYAALWAFAQTEIAAGNTLYNNGDGSTTFGIPDMRGRVLAAWDKMGGSASGRLTTAGGGIDGTTIGAVGGAQSKALVTANLPPYTPAGTNSHNLTGSLTNWVASSGFASGSGTVAPNTPGSGLPVAISGTVTFTGTAQGGTSTPVQIAQPTIVTNYILFAGA